jgi:hypothetical protein
VIVARRWEAIWVAEAPAKSVTSRHEWRPSLQRTSLSPPQFIQKWTKANLMMSPDQRANWSQQMSALTAAGMERMGACRGKWRQIDSL